MALINANILKVKKSFVKNTFQLLHIKTILKERNTNKIYCIIEKFSNNLNSTYIAFRVVYNISTIIIVIFIQELNNKGIYTKRC